MNPEVLEKVLACEKLPSLPAVAVQVIELTQRPEVSIKDLANVIQTDQALAAKIIRTVNSSFFGLRRKCGDINQAILLLGLAAVKTLALGFSLVSAVKRADKGEEFDFAAYWRRALYTGISARAIARTSGAADCEECFLGGLLQDIGMLALHQALGAEYDALIAAAAGDHRELLKHELTALETQHADIGAMLAARWKLPEQLIMPIKYHERPSAAPVQYMPIVRAVALGSIAADVLTAPEPAGPLARFYARGAEWFGLSTAVADDILSSITGATREVARLLQVDAGRIPESGEILARARERLAGMSLRTHAAEAGTPALAPGIDPTTALASRLRFEQTAIAAYEQATACNSPLTLVMFDVDGLDRINDHRSRAAGDSALAALGARIRAEFTAVEGLPFSLGDGRLAVLSLRADRLKAVQCAESVRRHLSGNPIPIPGGGALEVTTTVAVTCLQGPALRACGNAGEFVRRTEQVLQAAKAAGRNSVRIYSPPSGAAAA